MARVSSKCATTSKCLEDVVQTWDTGLVCPPCEIELALTHADSLSVKLFKYNDKADPKKAGRVSMWVGEAVKNADFRKKCPMLCGRCTPRTNAPARASSSWWEPSLHPVTPLAPHPSFTPLLDLLAHRPFQLAQITWRNGLWCHCDLRALTSASDHVRAVDGGWLSDYAKKKLNGTGPDERYVLYAHQLAGVTAMTYCVMGSCTNKESAFKGKQRNPMEELGPKETLYRKTGQMQAMPTPLHGGCMTGSVGEDGRLQLRDIEFNDQGSPRVQHAAGGAGPDGVAFSILATVGVGQQRPSSSTTLSTSSTRAQAAAIGVLWTRVLRRASRMHVLWR